MSNKYYGIEKLNGEILVSVEGMEEGSEEIIFKTVSGKTFKMHHDQDCCESVDLSDICGDVDDLLGAQVISAEERSNSGCDEIDDPSSPFDGCESWTWTFYDIQTLKGSVNLRWLGQSNGYYSETVYFEDVTGGEQ